VVVEPSAGRVVELAPLVEEGRISALFLNHFQEMADCE